MRKIVRYAGICLGIAFLTFNFSYASGSGSHSHGHHASEKGSDNATTTYKDSKGGVDAYLEFCDFKDLTGKEDSNFLVKCHARAYLKEAKTGESIVPSKIVLRATVGHDQFGEAMVFEPVNGDKMQTELIVKSKGEHHYLLIAEIEGVGIKEFHFHHTF